MLVVKQLEEAASRPRLDSNPTRQVLEFSACTLSKERAVGLLLWGGEGGGGAAAVIITLRYLQLSSETQSLKYVNLLSSPPTIGTSVNTTSTG